MLTEPQTAQTEHQTIDERAGHCFGCGPKNPQGLHLHFELGEGTATTTFNLTRLHEGAEGYLHGGIIATLLDEVMSKLNRPLGVTAMTRHLEVDYLRPCPVGTDLILSGVHVRREGRKLFHEGSIANPDGRILARGKGLFLVVDRNTLQG